MLQTTNPLSLQPDNIDYFLGRTPWCFLSKREKGRGIWKGGLRRAKRILYPTSRKHEQYTEQLLGNKLLFLFEHRATSHLRSNVRIIDRLLLIEPYCSQSECGVVTWGKTIERSNAGRDINKVMVHELKWHHSAKVIVTWHCSGSRYYMALGAT